MDGWPLAMSPSNLFGGLPKPITVSLRRDGVAGNLHLNGACRSLLGATGWHGAFLRRTVVWGTQARQLDGPGASRWVSPSGCPSGRVSSKLLGPPTREQFRPLPARGSGAPRPPGEATFGHDSYLVDSASSHMLVSKIKPCMSKYKQLYGETANGSLNQLSFI